MKIHGCSITTLIMLCVVAAPVRAADSPVGHWAGAIELPGTKLEIRLDLVRAPESGAWSGTIDIPAQMLRGSKLANLTVDGAKISFKLPNIPGDPAFDGALTGTGARIEGRFSQSGQTFPFAVERSAFPARGGNTPSRGVPGEGLVGHWQGSFRAGSVELRLVLHVEKGRDGTLAGTIDSIDQGVKGLPISAIALEGGVARIELARIRAQFEGRLNADGSSLEGQWKQGQLDTPIVFQRLVAAPELSRPQEPKKPYPYEERLVKFNGGAPGVELAGTLTTPPGEGPFPAIVLLSGSGGQDRDETIMGHRPFLVLADHLTRKGIVVLRYDDRGIARSTGEFSIATHEDFAADARAAWEFLKAQPKVDHTRVGLCGHSEGSVHAALVAADDKAVAFVVMLAGVGVPVDKLLAQQRQDLLRVLGAAHVVRPEENLLFNEIFRVLRSRGSTDETRVEVRTLIGKIAAHYTPKQREALGFTDHLLDQQVATLTSPWFIKLLQFDPAPVLARVDCPVLALNGERDIQVAARENLDGIRRALASGGNSAVTTVALPELNHLFQHSRTGAPSEYGEIEETISVEALTRVSGWVLRQVKS